MKITNLIKQIYFKITGYSYANLGRLFLRLFTGIMMMQFAVRQISNFPMVVVDFPEVIGMTSEVSLTVMICLELICSLFIMLGFLTRLMILPMFAAMIIGEHFLLKGSVPAGDLPWTSPVYIPILFLGIYFFLLLVGPGKISMDYFLSLHMLHSEDKNEDELEEV